MLFKRDNGFAMFTNTVIEVLVGSEFVMIIEGKSYYKNKKV